MPGKIKVKILAGRNLPVMDRSGDTTDAYVEIKFGNTTYKTDVCRKSLNPQWNSEWYKFEVEDAELQDEPLQIRLMDHDTYSANDAIGKVYVNLNPLLLPGVPPPVKNIWTLEASMNTGSQGGSVMTGWLPVYDTMHGIRGEVNIIVKVELFLDFNKFRQSSCGVTFFYSPIVPHGYHAQVIHGFVEELVVSDDPEYKWIDKIRTPRASNEARQTLFLKLSNEVQRKIGLKALDLGGNAVIGYLQSFDLEGESGIVARGIGTVVTLVKLHDFPTFLSEVPSTEEIALKSTKSQWSDCSESEGSPRSIARHHHHHNHHHHQPRPQPTTSGNGRISPPQLGSKFPAVLETAAPTPLRVVEYKYPLTRQPSVQSFTWRQPLGSSLSLADDVIDEASLRQMLALEDMRGEPQGSRFSRGLRNLRYLPQSVLAKRTRLKGDSVDEESDIDSIHSSSWSVGGSESTRSMSITDLQQTIRKKKLSHRKPAGEGMAAMLIRSVHAGGLPLDIVKEDRETPTPSPVNFIDDDDDAEENLESIALPALPSTEKITEEENLIEESDAGEQERNDDATNGKMLLVTYTKLKALSEDEEAIPMISSSESDTSSSEEDDEEDEPSESSTNYNILDDTLSLLDPSSPEAENCPGLQLLPIQLLPGLASQLSTKVPNEKEENIDLFEKTSSPVSEKEKVPQTPSLPLFEKKDSFLTSVDDVLSSEFSSDVDSDLPTYASVGDLRSRRAKKHIKLPEPLLIPLLTPTPQQEHSPKNGSKARHHRLHKQLSVVLDEEDDSESSEEEYYPKQQQRALASKEKQLLIKLNDDVDAQRNTPGRSVRRTETVIYKGPRSLLDLENVAPASPRPLSPVVLKASTPATPPIGTPAADGNHLKVPGVNLKDIVPKSPYPPEHGPFSFPDEARVAAMLEKRFRQNSMLELIRVIDSRMLTHRHSHTDSTRRRKHLTITDKTRNQTPSPDVQAHRANHRSSRSRSPELNPSHHHHHHHHHHHLKHVKNHYESSESIVDKLAHDHKPPKTNSGKVNLEIEILEMHALKTHDSTPTLTPSPSPTPTPTPTPIPTITPVPTPVSTPVPTPVSTPVPTSVSTPVTTPLPTPVSTPVSTPVPTPGPTSVLTPTLTPVPTSVSTPVTTQVPTPVPTPVSTSVPVEANPSASNSNNNIFTTVTNASEAKITNPTNATDNLCVSHSPSTRRQQQQAQQQGQDNASISPAGNQQHAKAAHSPAARNPGIPLHRRSSDSDLSITPKDKGIVKKGRSFRLRSDRSYYSSKSMLSDRGSGNSLTGSDRSMGGYLKPSSAIVRTMNQEALEMLEYPFITMQQYPPGFVLHIGGLVSARSVKLLERITNLEETEGRDSWWTEIRMEVRSHARALACNVVIGYREETSISDDVCVLSGSGTAAVINLHSTGQDQDNVLITHVQGPMTTSMESEKGGVTTASDKLKKESCESVLLPPQPQQPPQQPPSALCAPSNHQGRASKTRHTSESNDHEQPYVFPSSGCSLCHLPYNKSSINFQVNVSKCAVCRRAKVPDVLFTTVELPEHLPMTGRGCFIQATVCKAKKDLRGELNAKEISDVLPFLEYELHSLLLNKLRVRGMNAAFGLRVQVSIGERFVVGMAVGTAVYLTALPPPSLPQIATGNSWHNEDQLAEMQKCLVDTVKKNMEFYQLKPLPEVENGRSMSDTDESEDELPELDLGLGMKDVCVLEVDDVEDMDRISLLMDERPPNDFHVVNTETIPGLEDLEIVRNLQMFTQVSRAKIPPGQSASMPSKYFARLLQTVYFKLRRMVPCALCDLQFKIAMPEQDEIQLSVVGMALGLGEPTRCSKYRRRLLSHSISKDQVKRNDESDMIFSLDEDHAENNSTGESTPNVSNTPNTHASNAQNATLNASSQKPRPRSPLRIKHTMHRHRHVPLKERYGVDITPLSYLPGGRIERYLGNLNFFFIRESNSIRENGGLSGFIHSFVTEVLAIVRAHVTALGGNAMVAFFMTQCVLLHSPHKNQGQCLINIGGDVVNVSYFGNDKQQPQQQQQQQTGSTTTTAGGNC